MKIVYTSEAIEDSVRLRKFIEIKNPSAAKSIAGSLVDGIKKLTRFPYIGVRVSEAANLKLIRDLVLGSYIVRYLILDKTINILRIWHQREDDKNGL